MASGSGSKRGGGGGGKRRNERDFNVQLSMKLSGILRHGKDNFTQHIDIHGWLDMDTLLKHSHFCQQHNVTTQQINDIVNRYNNFFKGSE